MRTIGIDPGSRATGYGIVDKRSDILAHVDCGVIVPSSKAPLAERLMHIETELLRVIDKYRPVRAGIEDVFFARNWRSALKLGQARGAALIALARNGLDIKEYAPARVKQSVVGHGRAEKHQVQQMVKILLGLPEVPEENAADALAVAICRINDDASDLEKLLK